MSALGKVFLVINLVLALLFLGTSATLFSTRNDWREVAEKTQAEYQKKVQEFRDTAETLQGDVNELNELIRAFQTERVTMVKSLSDYKQQLSAKINEVEKARTDIVGLNEQITTKDKRITNQETEISKLRDQVRDLEKKASDAVSVREKAVQERDRMALELDTTKDELSKALTELESTRQENKDLADLVHTYQVVYPGLPPGFIGPKIDAKVFAVKPDQGLVVLTVGQDDKVEAGFKFLVYRGKEYIGQVQVIQVLADMCGAKILFTNKGKQIREGDDATTRL